VKPLKNFNGNLLEKDTVSEIIIRPIRALLKVNDPKLKGKQ
jgi:hypothetical protein